MAKEIWSWVKTLALAVLIALVIRKYAFAFYIVDGSSMEPTLQDGQLLVVNNFTYTFWQPKRGDVVIFHKDDIVGKGKNYWLTGKHALVKRVIALPGDTVYVADGTVYVNDSPLEEDYIECALTENYGPITLEPGWLFVLGDNRHLGASMDSRSFGPVEIASVLGRADYILLPSPHKVD